MGIKSKGSTTKAGDIKYHAANTVPAGWLACNGALLSRSAYAGLFLAIGTTYGAGDGSTTFAIPDLRGEFIRGIDNGRGVDSGRVFGSAQSDLLKSHLHGMTFDRMESNTFTPTGPALNGTGTAAQTFNTQNQGGAETRPRNVAMLACIKY